MMIMLLMLLMLTMMMTDNISLVWCAQWRPWGGVGGGADGEDAGAEPEQAGTWGGCPSLSEVDIYRFKSSFPLTNNHLLFNKIRNESGPDGFPKHEWIAGR